MLRYATLRYVLRRSISTQMLRPGNPLLLMQLQYGRSNQGILQLEERSLAIWSPPVTEILLNGCQLCRRQLAVLHSFPLFVQRASPFQQIVQGTRSYRVALSKPAKVVGKP